MSSKSLLDRVPRRMKGPRSKWARRASGALALLVALSAMGVLYSAFAPSSEAAPQEGQALDVRKGAEIYETSCITCHGANLQGVDDRGPSLIGVGEAAVYFQVHTGKMPLTAQGAQAEAKQVRFTEDEIMQLAAYVQEHGGGPTLPGDDELRGGALGEGGELFRLNCASCHNVAGAGGALSSGKHAPSLADATERDIYAAMLSGPSNMPVFGDNQITPEQKQAIVNYVKTLQESPDPGGNGMGRLGPVPEGLAAWLIGIGGLLLFLLWFGAKA